MIYLIDNIIIYIIKKEIVTYSNQKYFTQPVITGIIEGIEINYYIEVMKREGISVIGLLNRFATEYKATKCFEKIL